MLNVGQLAEQAGFGGNNRRTHAIKIDRLVKLAHQETLRGVLMEAQALPDKDAVIALLQSRLQQ